MLNINSFIKTILFLSIIGNYSFAFSANTSTLKILATQTDAEIYINGQLKGKTPKKKRTYIPFELEPGDYTVEIIKTINGPDEYYGKKNITLKKKSRKSLAIRLKMRPSDTFLKQHLSQYKDNMPPIDMVKIKAGSFQMGCLYNVQCHPKEFPVHQVQIKPFMMAKNEVTFEQWDACVVLGGCKHRPNDNDWGRLKRPVINVSWDDAQQYIKWLNSKTGETYRLPTEAEWEYATRAGTITPFYNGKCLKTSHENYNGEKPFKNCEKETYLKQTFKVASLMPNQWGLFDTLGNVAEWTQDCSTDNHKQASNDGSANLNGDCGRRIIKGNSWNGVASSSRAAHRASNPTLMRNKYLGFRLAKDN